MSAACSINLKNYYSNFKTIRGVAAVLGAIVPFLAKLKPGTSWTEYLLAPMGDVDYVARVLFAVLCVGVTYLVYFYFQDQSAAQRKRTFLVMLLIIPTLCLSLYIVFCLMFVRKIDITSIQRSVYVSVGYQRTEFAKQTFGSMTDEDMLRQRGFDDEQIRAIWTEFSILVARLALFASWSGFALSLICGLSLGALDQAQDAAGVSRNVRHRQRFD
jgi:hypothetical protein